MRGRCAVQLPGNGSLYKDAMQEAEHNNRPLLSDNEQNCSKLVMTAISKWINCMGVFKICFVMLFFTFYFAST